MSQPFVGEIRIFAGNFAPAGWAFCEGQTLQIAQNNTLFTLVGTTYGGNGTTNFRLPDLRGRIPIHRSGSHPIGESAGVEAVTLTVQQTPAHTHPAEALTVLGTSTNPANDLVARQTTPDVYTAQNPLVAMSPTLISPVGGSQPHTNVQPFLCVNFIISLFGAFPKQ
jgi:microcystin-dependent protein